MAKPLLGWPNLIDTATLSDGDWLPGLPLTQLKKKDQGKVARSVNATLASTKFVIDFGVARTIRALSLLNHNIGLIGKYRTKGYTPLANSNLLLYSEQLDNAAWTKNAATILANATAGSNGALTADKVIEAATDAQHSASASGTTVIGQTYVVSAELKAGERTQAAVEFFSGGSVKRVVISLVDGSLVSQTGTGTYAVTALTGGWYRISVSGVAAAASSALQVYIASAGAISYAGNGTNGIYMSRCQLEGDVLGLYKPTSGATSNITYLWDSAWNAAWAMSFDADLMTFESASLFEGVVDNEYAKHPHHIPIILDDWYTVRYVSIEIDDTTNADGYIQLGRIFVGGGFVPTRGASYGLEDSWVTRTEVVEMIGGGIGAVAKRARKHVSFELAWLTPAEGEVVHEMARRLDVHGEVLYLPDLGDVAKCQRYGMVGRMAAISAIRQPYVKTRSKTFEIKEL